MSALNYLVHQPDQVLEALRRGEIVALEEATEQLPDFFLLYAIESGLLDQLSDSFPDPRVQQPEIPTRILLAAGIAGHFAGLYALSQLPYALHSPRLLAQLQVQVTVNQPGNGLSRRGTQHEAPFHGDVLRKLLEQIAKQDKASKQNPGQTLIQWYNQAVGTVFCRAVNAQPCLHILDCTDLTVNGKNANYELSGVTSRQEHPKAPTVYERGYKLGTLRSLLDDGALMTAIAWGSIEQHDLTVTHDLVRQTPHLHPGDTLLEDRGFLDADTINFLKLEREVDVYTGLRKNMVLLRGAIAQAQGKPGAWEPHPTRKGQEIQRVTDLGSLWQDLKVPMNVCVVRFQNKQAQETAQNKQAQETAQNKQAQETAQNKQAQEWSYLGFATTDLDASAKQIIQMYQTRPEIEEDYRQLKSTAWHLDKFCATRLVQILWHVILTLLAYNLFQVYANTKQGQDFAGKTKQKIEREQRRKPVTYLFVCTTTAFGVYKTKELLVHILDLPDDIRHKIKTIIVQSRE